MGSVIDRILEDEEREHEIRYKAMKKARIEAMKKLDLPRVIGFTGKAKSGKDTAASVLVHEIGSGNCTTMAFADPLKQIAMIFGFTKEQCYDQSKKEIEDEFWGITPRKFLQITGTECFRNNFRTDCWTKLLEKRVLDIRKRMAEGEMVPWLILVTDVRFPNEVDCIKSLGGIVVKVTRPTIDTSGNMYKHPSEVFIDELKADISIENTFDNVDDYKSHCKTMFMEWLKKEQLVI